ncbi:MAG: FAD/NAD(P)-binding protein, partial [Planctomycetota bacterium]|nr:FAD/NAD(P)-binding protein [Planctomycetota bacterium]
EFHPDQTIPRAFMQDYVRWRRSRVANPLVTYRTVHGEAARVTRHSQSILVEMEDGQSIEGDRLIMASGSISVKVPPYLNSVLDNRQLIVDPLTQEGHEQRLKLPLDAKILVLGTGLTGEEQANLLSKAGHSKITLFSRSGRRHFPYPKEQSNKVLVLEKRPDFLMADTPEEFNLQLGDFFGEYLCLGHSPEDIFAAIRPFWDDVRAELGGCVKTAERLYMFKRTLAVNSIGAPWEVGSNIREAERDGKVTVLNGAVEAVNFQDGQFTVSFADSPSENYDFIINAIGRNIIRHSIWEQLLSDGLAKKHAGIGVRVGETGRMVNADDEESSRIWVVGMARAGDHTLRHGFLGNTAFNVPMVRSHLYNTMRDLLTTINPKKKPSL